MSGAIGLRIAHAETFRRMAPSHSKGKFVRTILSPTARRSRREDAFAVVADAVVACFAGTARTRSPSRRKLPARSTTDSPSDSPSRISMSSSSPRPVWTSRVCTIPSGDDQDADVPAAAVEDRRLRHGHAAHPVDLDAAPGERADARRGSGCSLMRTLPSRVALSTSG